MPFLALLHQEGKGIVLGAHRAIAAPGHAGSEEGVTKSLSPPCRLSRQPSAPPELSLWGWDITTQPRVTAPGALGQETAADTRDQLGDRAGGTEVMLDPVSGTAPQSCPTRATQGCPGCPQPPSRALRGHLLGGGSQRWSQQRPVTENC